jgi:hypothetical protein
MIAIGTVLLAAVFLSEKPVAESDPQHQLLNIRRVFVDRLTGGETAAQLRDLIISALQSSKLFIITENQERADAILRGAGEDLVFTDNYTSSDSLNAHSQIGGSDASSTTKVGSSRSSRSLGLTIGESESSHIQERKHEAMASVRLVSRDGDVVWSCTQESLGGKFRGASADVADKIARQLIQDFEKARRGATP